MCSSEEHASNLDASHPRLVMDEAGKWTRNLDADVEGEKEDGGEVELPDGRELGPDQLAYIVYSSGTTGKPKGTKQKINKNKIKRFFKASNVPIAAPFSPTNGVFGKNCVRTSNPFDTLPGSNFEPILNPFPIRTRLTPFLRPLQQLSLPGWRRRR